MRADTIARLGVILLSAGALYAQQTVPIEGTNLDDIYSTVDSLSDADQARLANLEHRRVHEIGTQSDVATFMELRRIALGDVVPSPSQNIIYYAQKNLGVPYKRRAYMFDLLEADCVTWLERVLAQALTENWTDANRLQWRLRSRNGDQSLEDRNHYPIADWLVNNNWLVEDITEQLGVEVISLEVVTDRRQKFLEHAESANQSDVSVADQLTGPEISITTSYVPTEELKAAVEHLNSGDMVLFIADYPDPTEGANRPRCIHQGFIHKVGGQIRVLHCVQPRAEEADLLRFIQKRIPINRFLGLKFLRLKPDARLRVQAELGAAAIPAVTPQEIDAQFGRSGVSESGVTLVTATQPPDEELLIDGLVYGAIDLEPGQTLYSLFKRNWQYVYELQANASFRAAHPDPHGVAESATPGRILFPMREP